MYETHYGLTAKPFSIVPNPNILFLSKNHKNALTYLEYGLSEKDGFILLTGEVGIGKTTLVRLLLNKMSTQMDIAAVFNTNISSEQLFRKILDEFELPCDTGDKSHHLETLTHFLIKQFARGRQTLLIIDEAQNLSDDVLEDIRMLFNLQTDNHILLQIILVGQPDLRRRLSSSNLRQLAQRIVVNYHLSPLSEEQTYQYIAFRLRAAGGPVDLFSPEAMELIYQKAGGIPRTINLLCDAGLVYGYGENKMHVDRTIIENVLADGICLTAATQAQQTTPVAETITERQSTDIGERITAIEVALAELQFGQEKFRQEIRSEVDQRLEGLKASQDESDQPYQQEDVQDHPDTFVFKDSAVAHAIEFENERRPYEEVAAEPAVQFQSFFARSRSDLFEVFQKRLAPLMAITSAWAKRAISHRYALWLLVLIIPLLSLWIMLGGKATSERYAEPVLESAPPPDLVSMKYEDESPAVEATANKPRATPPPPEKEETVIIHTIHAGETLLSIAGHYKVSAESIKLANNLSNSHLIYVGQTLKIPTPSSKKVSALEIK